MPTHRRLPAKARLLAHLLVAALLMATAATARAADPGCRRIDPTSWAPSGMVGCVLYGDGTASRWQGPGVARNDCTWPWTGCPPIRITSLESGASVVVTPTMFCGCWVGLVPGQTGPHGERPRLVDLDPATVAALGLDWSRGLYPVRVEPAVGAPAPGRPPALPDTAMSGDPHVR